MATTNYSVNYEDERFKDVEQQQANKLTEVNNQYSEMINQSDKFYQDQINANKQYTEQQQAFQNEQTNLIVDEINQQKEQAEKDYTKEQKGAYVDWRKQSNEYGAEAEQMASSGLQNTGYSESSQVSMYNQYQTRVATARESYSRAVLNYDNAIKEARLQNNSKLAELAYQGLQAQLELALNGFQYKNTLVQAQLEAKRQVESDYYNRWQNVLSQINTENSLAEQVRQYNENLAEERRQYNEKMEYQKQRDKVADSQWQKEYDLAKKASSSSGSSGGSYSGGGSYSSSGSTTANKNYSTNSTTNKKETANKYGNSTSTTKKKDYYFSNGYQPQYVNNKKVAKSGLKVWNVFAEGTSNKNATAFGKQNIWKAGNKYYVWVGNGKKGGDYVDVTAQVNGSKKNKVNYLWGR